MENRVKLTLVRFLHTLIWLSFNLVIIYMYYAVFSDNVTRWVWIGFGLILLEGLILLLFKMSCPLTVIARKYSSSTRANFDIYLPQWLARYNKIIYTGIVLLLIIVLLVKHYFIQN
jgi:hypothetical protein